MINHRPILAFCLFFLVLVSCTRKEVTESYLIASSCEAPCWMGITPGITSEEEAIQALKEASTIVDTASIVSLVESDKRQVRWQFIDSNVIGQVEFINGKASSIIIGSRIENRAGYNLNLDWLIERYGEPTDVYFRVGGGDVLTYRLFLVNAKLGFMFMYSEPMMNEYHVSPDTKIDGVIFFDDQHFQDLIKYSIGEFDLEKRHFEWSGYGKMVLP